MTNKLKIFDKKDSYLLEMWREVLDLSINISSHINDNFENIDFSKIANTSHEALSNFLKVLHEFKKGSSKENLIISVRLNKKQFDIIDRVFYAATNYGTVYEKFKGQFKIVLKIEEIFIKERMKDVLKINKEEDLVRLEMSRNILALSIKLTNWINENFEWSDFFTIANTGHEELVAFLEVIQEIPRKSNNKNRLIEFCLDEKQYWILRDVFRIISSFHDEEFEDEIEEIDNIDTVLN